MLGRGWLALRQAKDALKNDRLDEARRLLLSVQDYRRAKELLARLGVAYAVRGQRRLDTQEHEKAWQDLLLATELNETDPAVVHLREKLTRLGLDDIRDCLTRGNVPRAGMLIDQLRSRHIMHLELAFLEGWTNHWSTAKDLADRGEHAKALQTLENLQGELFDDNPHLKHFRARLEAQQARLPDLLARLHQSQKSEDWRAVIEAAEQVLALAPQHQEARRFQQQAWKSLEPVTVVERTIPTERHNQKQLKDYSRFHIWIDGVGGYLVCLGQSITLGRAEPNASVDVPILADVSRKHATILRDSEGHYVIDAAQPIAVNGETVKRSQLKTDDRITLGKEDAKGNEFQGSCQLQFRKPNSISASAGLIIVSGHPIATGADEVLLMSESLILGPSQNAHVQIPNAKEQMILANTKEGLRIKCEGKLRVNHEAFEKKALLQGESLIQVGPVTFAIEPVVNETAF